MERSRITSVIAAALPPVALFACLLVQHIVPGGVMKFSYVPSFAEASGGNSPYVGSFLPQERVSHDCRDVRGACVEVMDDPVYLFVNPPPGNFTDVSAMIHFDSHDQPTMEFGPMTDVFLQRFDLRPLAAALFEGLRWDSTRGNAEGTTTAVWSRTYPQMTVDEALQMTWPSAQTVAYKTNIQTSVDLTKFALQAQKVALPTLVGAHELQLYDGDSLGCRVTDVNKVPGDDAGVMTLRDAQGTIRSSANFPDNVSDEPVSIVRMIGRASSLVLTATSDIVWRDCQAITRGLVFNHRINTGTSSGFDLFTNSSRVTMRATSKDGLQTVRAGDRDVNIATVGQKYTVKNDGGLLALHFTSGDVEVTGDGLFSLTSASFFSTGPAPLSVLATRLPSSVDTAFATFAPVMYDAQGWRVGTVHVRLADVALERGAIRFALSLPGVQQAQIKPTVHRIDFVFTRRPLSPYECLRAVYHFFRDLL